MLPAESEHAEVAFLLEGAASFLAIVFETIDAHLDRTLDPYESLIVGIDSIDAGTVETDEEAIVRVYVEMLSTDDPDDVVESLDDMLDQLADEHDMTLARQSVTITPEPSSLASAME